MNITVRYEHDTLPVLDTCDALVIGGSFGRIAAALALARAGERFEAVAEEPSLFQRTLEYDNVGEELDIKLPLVVGGQTVRRITCNLPPGTDQPMLDWHGGKRCCQCKFRIPGIQQQLNYPSHVFCDFLCLCLPLHM